MKIKRVFSAALAAVIAVSAFSDAKGDEIMQKTHNVPSPEYARAQIVMLVQDTDGTTEQRNILGYAHNKDGTVSTTLDFRSPANLKDTRFLMVKNADGSDGKWIYLPALKSTRRVNSSEGSRAFLGTDATYDDLSSVNITGGGAAGGDLSEDTHEWQREETKNGFSCDVLKNTPVDTKSSHYGYRLVWVDKATSYPVYTELYDKDGKLVKTLSVLKIENHGGYNIPMENVLETVATGHRTELRILKVDFETRIPDRVFTQDFLSTGK